MKAFAPTLEARSRRGHHPAEKDAGVVYTTYPRSLIYFIVERRRCLKRETYNSVPRHNDDLDDFSDTSRVAAYLKATGGGSVAMTNQDRCSVVVAERVLGRSFYQRRRVVEGLILPCGGHGDVSPAPKRLGATTR